MKKSIILFLFLASLISCTANNTVTEDIFKTEKEGMKEVNNNATIEVIVGEQIKLFSYAEYPRGNPSDKIQWSVSNTSLANLNNGVLTALALGSVTVIAKSTENPAKNKRFIFKIVKEKIIPATPTPVGESTPLVSVSSGMTANPNSTPNPNSSASNSPVTSPTPIPIPTPSKLAIDNAEKISFITGQIYNTDGSPVKNCKITATSIDKSLVWSTEQTVKDGVYLIKDVPINVVIDLIVEKDGWTTRTEHFNKNSNS